MYQARWESVKPTDPGTPVNQQIIKNLIDSICNIVLSKTIGGVIYRIFQGPEQIMHRAPLNSQRAYHCPHTLLSAYFCTHVKTVNTARQRECTCLCVTASESDAKCKKAQTLIPRFVLVVCVTLTLKFCLSSPKFYGGVLNSANSGPQFSTSFASESSSFWNGETCRKCERF